MTSPKTVHHVLTDASAATSYFDDFLQVIAFYDLAGPSPEVLPVEVRSWRAERSITKNELQKMQDIWDSNPPPVYTYGISSEQVRGIPLGVIHRMTLSALMRATLQSDSLFVVPTSEQIELVVDSHLVPDRWRNSRDFRAHARELRGVAVYLQAVYGDLSVQPMRAVADKLGVDLPGARKIIEQARAHGYLTRTSGPVGGLVTDKARRTAWLIEVAVQEAESAS